MAGKIKDFLAKTPVSNVETETLESQCSEAVAALPVPALEPSTSTSTLSENVESVEPTGSTIEATSEAETEVLTEMGPEMTSTILLSEDPGLWPRTINNEEARRLVERGPPLIGRNYQFPTNEDKRQFSSTYFVRKLENGETTERIWLIYSVLKNSVFCFCCKVFGKTINTFSDSNGFSDWQHLSLAIKRHETSIVHNVHMNTWMSLKKMLKLSTTVNDHHLRVLETEKKYWHDVLERIVAVVKFLSRQCLAFQGSSKILFQHDNGNFLKAVEMISSFDPVMREHLSRVQNSQENSLKKTHYLGYQIQNEIVELMSSKVKNNILNMVRNSKYYSIIMDCTPDTSHTEQISLVLRYVVLNHDCKKVQIQESFLAFSPIFDSTGEGLFDFVVELLRNSNLDIKDMRGQGYDNGANMRGKHIGLQKRILDANPRAFFVPCAAHSLNLAVNDAAKVSNETVNFFNIVQELYVFFSSSTKRWNIIKKNVPELNLKPLSDTRWSSRVDAIKPLKFHLIKICESLLEIADNDTFNIESRHKASSLLLNIQSFRFICSVIIWYDVLFRINIVSKMMQSVTIDINVCQNYLKNLIVHFKNCRNDNFFEEIIAQAAKLAADLEIEQDFPAINTTRQKYKPKFFDYEHRDEAPQNPKTAFKVNFFLRIIDQVLSSLNSRFHMISNYDNIFGFFGNIFTLCDDDLLKNCQALQQKLTDAVKMETDIEADVLFNEIKALKLFSIPHSSNPLDILQYIFEHNLTSSLPNVTISLRILLTLPVSVASGERSFSKLKIIKNFLRSTMHQERLSGLAILAIEQEMVDKIDFDEVIKEFAAVKSRKTPI